MQRVPTLLDKLTYTLTFDYHYRPSLPSKELQPNTLQHERTQRGNTRDVTRRGSQR